MGGRIVKIVPAGKEHQKNKPTFHQGLTGNFVSLQTPSMAHPPAAADVDKCTSGPDVQVLFAGSRADVHRSLRQMTPLHVRRDRLTQYQAHYETHRLLAPYHPSVYTRRAPPAPVVAAAACGRLFVSRSRGSRRADHRFF